MTTRYELGDYVFDLEAYFPRRLFDQITAVRVEAPEIIDRQAAARQRRTRLAPRGRLAILAADHPARGVTGLGADPFRMADRHQYLGRIIRILIHSDFDGFMSTPDMIEDLLIVDYLIQAAGGASFLDDRLLIGCMQRGGVAGVSGEIDDRFTAYTAESIARYRLDGGKMLLRFVPEDERTLNTLNYCSQAVTALNRYELPAFVEPLYMVQREGRWQVENDTDTLVRLAGVCAGLGDAARNTWLKLPYCPDFFRVTMATTLPILMLGGPSQEDPRDTYADFATAMAARANVRGAMVGRNVTFPGAEDPAAVAQAVSDIIHLGISPEEAVVRTMAYRDRDSMALARYAG